MSVKDMSDQELMVREMAADLLASYVGEPFDPAIAAELQVRFGADALEYSASWFTGYHYSSADIVREAALNPEGLAQIMRGEVEESDDPKLHRPERDEEHRAAVEFFIASLEAEHGETYSLPEAQAEMRRLFGEDVFDRLESLSALRSTSGVDLIVWAACEWDECRAALTGAGGAFDTVETKQVYAAALQTGDVVVDERGSATVDAVSEGRTLLAEGPQEGVTDDDVVVTYEERSLDVFPSHHVVVVTAASKAPRIPTEADIAASVVRAKAEIVDDMIGGTVPVTVADFSELHSFVDANTYGGWCDEGTGIDWAYSGAVAHDGVYRAQDVLDAWIKSGEAAQAARARGAQAPAVGPAVELDESDATALLKQIRAIVRDVRVIYDDPESAARVLADAIEKLDQSITSGGMLPTQWES